MSGWAIGDAQRAARLCVTTTPHGLRTEQPAASVSKLSGQQTRSETIAGDAWCTTRRHRSSAGCGPPAGCCVSTPSAAAGAPGMPAAAENAVAVAAAAATAVAVAALRTRLDLPCPAMAVPSCWRGRRLLPLKASRRPIGDPTAALADCQLPAMPMAQQFGRAPLLAARSSSGSIGQISCCARPPPNTA